MLTITESFLKCCPNWAKAGWKPNDVCDLTTLPPQELEVINKIPPHKPPQVEAKTE